MTTNIMSKDNRAVAEALDIRIGKLDVDYNRILLACADGMVIANDLATVESVVSNGHHKAGAEEEQHMESPRERQYGWYAGKEIPFKLCPICGKRLKTQNREVEE